MFAGRGLARHKAEIEIPETQTLRLVVPQDPSRDWERLERYFANNCYGQCTDGTV